MTSLTPAPDHASPDPATNPTPAVTAGPPSQARPAAPTPDPFPFPFPMARGPRTRRREVLRGGGVLRRDARIDQVPAASAFGVAVTPVAGWFALMVVFAIHKPWLYLILREDYPVEWAQFSLCLFASIVALAAAIGYARRGQRLTAALMVLVALGAFGLAGEEISWGQRVFGLAEPHDLARVNEQGELNVHDTYVGGIAVDEIFELFSFLIGLAGVGLSLLTRGRRPLLAGRLWWHLSPPLFTVPGFLSMVLYRPLVLVTPASVAAPVTIFQEWIEFCLYGAIAATVVCVYRRALPGRTELLDAEPRARWVLGPGAGATPLVATVAVLVLVLTVVFAVMTIQHGMVPANVTVFS